MKHNGTERNIARRLASAFFPLSSDVKLTGEYFILQAFDVSMEAEAIFS